MDNVYSACFCKQQNDVLLGTFDNSLTNYVMLLLMKELNKTQIVYIFADNEESDNPDILNVPLFSYKTFLFNICLDVTPYCHYTHICTIENDNFNLAKKITKNGICLLSPAAASYGDFDNFEHRGKVFKQLVQENIRQD